ncbi:MAG: S-adenosylmethionine:tRNA ribosyltransferase-isomerase, partial [Desulfobulbaceae bacterium]|nr:S-adenosylmethionine:tRNA ribosyltransferase-isomerase [Desulfobulbaceae bacterium]
AGLHFSDELLEAVRAKGVIITSVTLHVGYGTFAPVRVEDIRDHKIHAEHVKVSPTCAGQINGAKAAGGRVWAVGTTTVRTLEAATDESGVVGPLDGPCNLFIYPGYRFRVVDNLITNFHLPKSSLLFLVSALAGRERVLSWYRLAVTGDYRFFSYGDAMAVITKE